MIERVDVTGIILCGGKGSRLNGLDKPLIALDERRIVDLMIERLLGQVGQLVLSCSRNVALYEALGHQVAVDNEPGRGPLAGLYESFSVVTTEWALTMPGDIPFLPDSLVYRLRNDAYENGVAVPITQGQRQNLCLLLNRSMRQKLCHFYEGGGRAAKHWLDDNNVNATDLSDLSANFFDVNTLEDLREAKSRLIHSSN